jgi:hypothetical protein
MSLTNAPLSEEQVWQLAQACASRLAGLQIPGLLGIFAIGSLPGGYFRPGQSDLDLVCLLGESPAENALTEQFGEAIAAIIAGVQAEFGRQEMEVFLRRLSELRPDETSGLTSNPDLTARLLKQSRQLWGDFSVDQLKMPTKADFAAELARYRQYWAANAGQRPSAELSDRALTNHALTLMRLYLAARYGQVEYDKRRIVPLFLAEERHLALPSAIIVGIQQVLAGNRLGKQERQAFEAGLQQLQQIIPGGKAAA